MTFFWTLATLKHTPAPENLPHSKAPGKSKGECPINASCPIKSTTAGHVDKKIAGVAHLSIQY